MRFLICWRRKRLVDIVPRCLSCGHFRSALVALQSLVAHRVGPNSPGTGPCGQSFNIENLDTEFGLYWRLGCIVGYVLVDT